MKYTIREIKKQEYGPLEDFLYEAIFLPEGATPPPRSILEQPELQIYLTDFGSRKDDIGMVAETDGKVVGAVWVRIMNDYGHVDDHTPSFAISLYKEYRGAGIGTAMMQDMLGELRERGYSQASLAVQKANYAVRMYQKVGFEIVDENEEEYIMVCELENKMKKFLIADEYVDYEAQNIQAKALELFAGVESDVEKARIAYEFVRDEIPHSFDCDAKVITARASDVLKHGTGICHAKSNLLAALLRSQGIPTGFCFQHITLVQDDSMGYCVHAYNAVYLENRWVKLDARGNKEGVNAAFSLAEPILAFPNREQYDEYFWNGIYARSHAATMQMLEKAKCLQDILDNIPDEVTEAPDLAE